MTQLEKQEVYQERLNKEREIGWISTGCFFCGGVHPSDTCHSPESREWWRDEREAIR